MSDFFVVVDNLKDWSPYYPSQDVITFDDYLHRVHKTDSGRVRVINLSRRYKYLSTGYYCSLLAEARGHHVLPSVRTLNDVGRKSLAVLQLEDMEKQLARLPAATEGDIRAFRCWFGECLQEELLPVAHEVFERFPCPILEVVLIFKKNWEIKSIKPVSLTELTTTEEQEAFANTFEKFSSKMWRQPKSRKTYRYDLAILVDPEEKMPPSDAKALKRFVRAAKQLGIAAEFITKKDYMRIPEYDGLFIRETTTVDHHTYRFAKKAEAEDLVVIDDPTSILRCTNKIYLADLLQTHKVPTPRTEIFSSTSQEALQQLVDSIGFPMVLKIPDGSFSRGVVKVENLQELEKESRSLMQNSALLLAQEFIYTGYDWRIGVLNNKPLYACRYYMVKKHWQIYQHGGKEVKAGGYDTLPTFEVPKPVLDVATKATRLIGDGFYGVDIKQSDDRVVVIEVNDNPSIESGVEDKYLGEQLYMEIMEEFLRRMAARRR
ncbi:MAG: carboxylate--amine ligase [Gammaproteobacteria bacterium SG8_15]|nr:MAG: carboxylate--amine ligase [Gammaproteobacteria bacterium SG8_15]